MPENNTPVNLPTSSETSGSRARSTGAKIGLFIGGLAVIILGIFAITRYAPSALSSLRSAAGSLSSVFTPGERITVTATPQSIISGQSFALSWDHSAKSTTIGMYTVSFVCTDGVGFSIKAGQTIPCGTDFRIGTGTTINLIGATKLSRSDVTLTVSFYGATSTSPMVKGTRVVTITNQKTVTISTTPTPVPTVIPGDTATNASSVIVSTPDVSNTRAEVAGGTPDLAIHLLARGVLDYNNRFIAKQSVSGDERPSIRFSIENVGNAKTGRWTFSAVLPTERAQKIFNSERQISLLPGDRIEYTLGFDELRNTTTNDVLVSVDDANQMSESNEANNTLSVTFVRDSYSNNNGTYYPTPIPYGTYPNYGTTRDFSVRILQTGIFDRNTNQFFPTISVRAGQKAGVKFEVTNLGTTETGVWTFRADLPTNPITNYISELQPSLRGGEKAEFTLGFENMRTDGYGSPLMITVDQDYRVGEIREDNNTASVSIPITY